MKTILAWIGGIFLIATLSIAGFGFYSYKKLGSSMMGLADIQAKNFTATHHPNAHVTEALKRIQNGARLKHTFVAETLELLSMSALAQPGELTAEQEAMLEEAATLMEHEPLDTNQIESWRHKYAHLLPKNRRERRTQAVPASGQSPK